MFAEFTRWTDTLVRRRFTVIGVMVAGLLALGVYGLGLGDHLSVSGWDDPTSESARAARLKDEAFGHDHIADVLLLFHAPAGKTIDDPAFAATVVGHLNSLPQRFPDQITKINASYWPTDTGLDLPDVFGSPDRDYAFASVAIRGGNDTLVMRNYRTVADEFPIPGIDMEVAGGQPVAAALNDTMAHDQRRMELFAVPAVAVLLFFLFGGVVAAALPLVVGGLTVLGAWGIIRALTTVTEVNSFVSPVVSMIGLGLAIDYGLFIVSRFREELADGHEVPEAVRRTVATAGRTVVFSAIIVVVAAGAILLFPQGFLRSFAFGAMVTVTLAALISITVLPAMLAVLGRRVDRLGFNRFHARRASDRERDNPWGRVAGWVMRRPLAVAVPLVAVLVVLIAPVRDVAFGGISERFLPPQHPARTAQQHFDQVFPLRQMNPVDLVLITHDTTDVDGVVAQAGRAPGLIAPFPRAVQGPGHPNVFTTSTVLRDAHDANATIDYLRSMPLPKGTTVLIGGQPAKQRDSVDALLRRMPLMIALVFLVTTVLMVLAFGSVVLPLKAAMLNLLGLGSTLGVLTWIFVEGHGAGLLDFTPQPIMALVLVLIVAVIYGLSTDYEVFLLARIVEARAAGATTTEAVRAGIARTGWIITAAALILLVVTGAFALSDLVMMQYIAFGMVAALFIDATILRMLLVPAIMRLLGDACWWAPSWLRRGVRHNTSEAEEARAEAVQSSERP
ncbi:MMPL family transporter [Nocardia gamkensis]|uniref:MMPL family transporter n=1 Tax=Nocardia gamkensis TaxID=352869 RepID=A0A7X6KYS9_9NOCA|nr:MMPL family transporter [Nocardia gamkensis]NKY24660.1 MMPL family transporter [Nocardia gamkensis]NQE69869.1 Trehalose monomycolate exporter MmpL3 [Nocardia gamkensis]